MLSLLKEAAPQLTHEALAIMSGVNQSTVTRALNGRGLTRPDVAVSILDNLGATHTAASVVSQECPDAPGSHWQARLDEDAADTSAQTRALVEQTAPHQRLDALEDDVDRLCRTYVHTPVADLYPHIRARRHDALTLATGPTRPDQSQRLHIAATRFVGLQVHAAMDTGSYATATVHAKAALALAERTGDPALQAWVWSLLSLIAYWDGRPNNALQAAEQGLTHQVTDSNLARLHALRARAAAATGDAAVARAAIGAATDHAELKVLPGVLGFPTAKIHTYAATTLLAAGSAADRTRSIGHAHHAITLYSTGEDRSVGDQLAARLDLATAHVQNRDSDGALEQVEIISTVPATLRTASIAKRTGRLVSDLACANTNAARLASQLLTDFTPTSASTTRERG